MGAAFIGDLGGQFLVDVGSLSSVQLPDIDDGALSKINPAAL